ncbi:unnamed protein product [Chrysoparadoxa australica]
MLASRTLARRAGRLRRCCHTRSSKGGRRFPSLMGAAVVLGVPLAVAREDACENSAERRIQSMYQFLEKPSLGQGAFGEVLCGKHKDTGELVAIKQLPRDITSQRAFEHEVEMLRLAGNHKNVISLRDVFEDEEASYIVMEMAKGGELFDRLVGMGPYSEREAAKLMRDMLMAVAYIHHHNIVHFDIKPENIMLAGEEDGDALEAEMRLVDFGSAVRLADKDSGEGQETGRRQSYQKLDGNTAAYSAPEILLDKPFDSKADIWALGVIMYLLLSGVHPFDLTGTADDEEVKVNILLVPHEGLDFSDPVWEHVSPMAKDLIRRMLSFDQSARPSAAEALKSDWLRPGSLLSDAPLEQVASKLREFHAGRLRLKACLLSVMVGLAGRNLQEEANVGSRTNALATMDLGGKGYIDKEDLRVVMERLGQPLDEKDLLEMMRASDGDPKTHQVNHIPYKHMFNLVPPLCPCMVEAKGGKLYDVGDIANTFYLVNRVCMAPLCLWLCLCLCLCLSLGGIDPDMLLPHPLHQLHLSQGQVGLVGPDGQVFHKASRRETFGATELLSGGEPGVHASLRGTQAVCLSPVCEVLPVPQHLFKTLEVEFPAVRRRLDMQVEREVEQLVQSLLDRAQNNVTLTLNPGERVPCSNKGGGDKLVVARKGKLRHILSGSEVTSCSIAEGEGEPSLYQALSGVVLEEVLVTDLIKQGLLTGQTLRNIAYVEQRRKSQ